MTELDNLYSDPQREKMAIIKLRSLRQMKDQLVAEYTSKFNLIAVDCQRYAGLALIQQYINGLKDEVQDLLFTMLEPISLQGAADQAMKCNTKLAILKANRDLRNAY